MGYKRYAAKAYVRKTTSSRFSPYRRSYGGVRKGHYRGFRGAKGSGFRSSYKRGFSGGFSRRKYAPKVQSRSKGMFRPGPRKPLSASRAQVLATAVAMAPTGVFTYGGKTSRVAWDSLTQGVSPDDSVPQLYEVSDVYSVMANAIVRTQSTPSAATVVYEPRFWIRKAVNKITMTSRAQTGMDVTIYPWVARYGTSQDIIFNAAEAVQYETNAASSTSVSPNVRSIGWTPFFSKAITSMYKLLKPRTVHLEGGQSFHYTLVDRRPMYVTPGKLGLSTSIGFSGNLSFERRTKGCYIIAKGVVVNDSTIVTDIGLSAGALDIQEVRSYEWVAPNAPNHFYDNFPNTVDVEVGAYNIVQPQTGVITTDPVEGI